MPKVRKAEYQDIQFLIDNIRDADKEELKALCITPENSVRLGFLLSDKVYSVLDDNNQTIAMFGIIGENYKECRIWLRASNLINKHKIYVLRNSKYYLNELVEGYSIAYNAVHSKNSLHIKWLEWLGAVFTEEIEYNQALFKKFHIKIGEY